LATTPKKKLSVLKRVRQTVKRNMRNRGVLSEVKTYRKKFDEAIATKDQDKVTSALRTVVKVIDQAATKGAIHRNTASRTVARLSRRAHAALNAAE